MSQEWNRSITPNCMQITVPTAAERTGDFSLTHDAAGVPEHHRSGDAFRGLSQGTPFPGNKIPAYPFQPVRPVGSELAAAAQHIRPESYNYQSQIANSAPSFDQVYRVDYNISDKWRFFVRRLNSKQTQNIPYGRADTSNNLG